MSREVPSGWNELSLGDICAGGIITDGDWIESKDQDPNGQIRLLQLSDIGDGEFLNKTRRFINEQTAERLKVTYLKKYDILIARMPDPLGRCCLLPLEEKAITAVDVCVIRPSEATDRSWLSYLLNSPEVRALINAQGTGTTRTRVSRKSLASLSLVVPPLREQRRIAEILSSVDEAIAATRAVVEQTRKVRSKILSTLFPEYQAVGSSTADDTFEGWSVEPASSICESIIDCKNRTPPVTEDGYAVVRTPNVRNGRFRYEGLQFTDKQSFQEWTAKGMPRAGDILFTREAPYGEVCMAPAMAFCLGQRMMFLRPDTSRVSSDFLLYALQSVPVRKEMFRRAGGSTVGHLRVGDVRELPIPVAPRDVQLRLTSTLRSLDEALYSNEESLSRLEACKSALMSDLLTGRKHVTDALPLAAE